MDFYTNKRIVFNETLGKYELADVNYNNKGEVTSGEPTSELGETMQDVKELLTSLLNDIEHWSEEELTAYQET